jgi:hypothetical protein
VTLALAILFLWIGCALLAVAFHPLGAGADASPLGVFETLHGRLAAQGNAADTTNNAPQ